MLYILTCIYRFVNSFGNPESWSFRFFTVKNSAIWRPRRESTALLPFTRPLTPQALARVFHFVRYPRNDDLMLFPWIFRHIYSRFSPIVTPFSHISTLNSRKSSIISRTFMPTRFSTASIIFCKAPTSPSCSRTGGLNS